MRMPTPCAPETWKLRGVVVEPTEPWEGQRIQNFFSTAEPLGDGRWRLWYSSACPDVPFAVAVAEGVPGQPMRKILAELSEGPPNPDAELAIGNLPADWRPVQPVHIKLQNGKHRIYFWAHGPDVVRFIAAESDDDKHYQVINKHNPCMYHFYDRAVEPNDLPDGLTIIGNGKRVRPDHEIQAPEPLVTNDATTVYQLSDGTFEMYTCGMSIVGEDDPRYKSQDNAAGAVRVVDRLVSEDGLNWTGRQRIFEPDSTDPADVQYHHLCVTYTEKGRVGMLGVYRTGDGPGEQHYDIEWCFSEDGINWERPNRLQKWLNQPAGEGDCFSVYPASSIVMDEGMAWLFYTCHYGPIQNDQNVEDPYENGGSSILLAQVDSIFAS